MQVQFHKHMFPFFPRSFTYSFTLLTVLPNEILLLVVAKEEIEGRGSI